MKMTVYACNTPTSDLPKVEDEDIVCAPRERGSKRREDQVERTSGLSAVPAKGNAE